MVLGFQIEWDEEPFEWIYPQRYGCLRRYTRGPVKSMRILVEVEPSPQGGSRIFYNIWMAPHDFAGEMAIPLYIGMIIKRRLQATIRQYDRLARQQQQLIDIVPGPANFAAGGKARLWRLRNQLQEQGESPDLLERLVQVICEADEISAARLRPYVLADAWGVSRRAMLELSLRATSIGMLDFQWELLCPLCRNSNANSVTLSEVNPQVHCRSCNIDYTVNFDRSVELTFRPNPAIRAVRDEAFCVGGPNRTPHIIMQQFVPAHTHKHVSVHLESGRYRLRTLFYSGAYHLRVSADGISTATFTPDPSEADSNEMSISQHATLQCHNTTAQEQIFLLERMAWSDQAVTAAEVTALQLFRSLFSSEALRPGERISVGSITLVFTDLRGSTRLYREIGDAPAFGRVMNHFDVLKESIAREGGGIVKTIGDAVMAVFPRPLMALRAMLTAQHALANPPDGMLPLRLKASIHSGACIAVSLNERLDYFGSTVNIAARLEGLSSGENVIISSAVRNDPEIDAVLKQYPQSLNAEPFTQNLKGFDNEVFDLWRIMLSSTAPSDFLETASLWSADEQSDRTNHQVTDSARA